MNDVLKKFEEFRFDSERIAQELSRATKLPYYNLQFFKPDIDALKYVSKNIAENVKVIPIKKERNTLVLGIIDPYNDEVKRLKSFLESQGLNVELGIISYRSFEIGLEEYKFLSEKKVTYASTFEINQNVLREVKEKIHKRTEIQELLKDLIKTDPFLILDYLLAGAIKFTASDIHFEPYEEYVLVRYRLDGILYDIFSFPLNIYQIIKNRIKVLAGLMINIKDKPQDGRFSIIFENEVIDIRTSVIPARENEAIVLRLLIFSLVVKELEALGLRKDDLDTLNYTIRLPNGLILNTGPTGSGKTTTLYAIILRIKSPEIKIITIEDPIEYKIEGISQSQVEEEKGFTFASALRAFLRHDPDVILVGEIRDKETAQTAIQASLTGHLVLSTLHTNDSLGAIPRLISLEVDPKLIPSALRLVIAQRLVRKVCPYCQFEYQPDNDLKKAIKSKLSNLPSRVDMSFVDLDDFVLVKSKGCDKCFDTGYKGMIGTFEFLRITKNLEELIYKRPSEAEVYRAVKDDFVSLQQDALIKALMKITTIEEVERVTGPVI